MLCQSPRSTSGEREHRSVHCQKQHVDASVSYHVGPANLLLIYLLLLQASCWLGCRGVLLVLRIYYIYY
jgi:hypothetical protein